MAATSEYMLVPMAQPSPSTWQLIGQMSTIGMSFVFALVIGFGAGYWLDGVLGTRPWLSFVGFFLGLAAGVLNVYRVMQLASAKDSSKGSSGSRG
jgi:F0F1-type ATP synthase assembly protein I